MVRFGYELDFCAWLEVLVLLFQVCGVLALCLFRLAPSSTRWASHGRVGFIIAMFGLGIAGAMCGRHDSEFGLFAGGTMTFLLIGMTIGGGSIDSPEAIHLG
jgi:hypothetical protein